jgi:alkanesulfonate monooxygenase SsuD/methylene tetrahydromethanopterin reductase-like flavin-dependent oxidoreductase (luciferase family)
MSALEIGVSTLSDLQSFSHDGRRITPLDRMRQIVALAERADAFGLDVFGVGEHHSADFLVSSPAVVLAAIAARTTRIRLTSAVTVLSVLDPVRVMEDYALLDLVSEGRAEITAGRSAFVEPFALFGLPLDEYGELFEEKLELLLRLREEPDISWRGRYRAPINGNAIMPRPLQNPLPLWIGAGGSPDSIVRAARLGLPLILGYLGGTPQSLARLTDLYRATGEEHGTSDRLRVGVAIHYLATTTEAEASAAYRNYFDFLRPKRPGGSGFAVSHAQFEEGRAKGGALMIGETARVIDKLLELQRAVRFDRVQSLIDWGGLPAALVAESLEQYGTEVAPALRGHATSPDAWRG